MVTRTTGVEVTRRAAATACAGGVVVAARLALASPAAPARAQATEQRHRILRYLPVRFRHDDRYDRVYPLHVLEVSGSPGTPDQYKVEDAGASLRIRIGDPDRTISGRHDYTSWTGSRGR